MCAGSVTVIVKSPWAAAASIGTCPGRPSTRPKNMAEAVWMLAQDTSNVTWLPGLTAEGTTDATVLAGVLLTAAAASGMRAVSPAKVRTTRAPRALRPIAATALRLSAASAPRPGCSQADAADRLFRRMSASSPKIASRRGRQAQENAPAAVAAASARLAIPRIAMAGYPPARRANEKHCGRHGKIGSMLRWLTAGESHGRALVAVCDGVPAGVEVTAADIALALARRRAGYGRGARMKFEQDEVELTGGVRHGVTLGGPVAIRVGNTEWPKWETVMSPDPVPADELERQARNAPLSRPRPGHADLVGMQKYGFTDARPILERASARETAARVALGEVARRLLEQALGVTVLSHVVQLGSVAVPDSGELPAPGDLDRIDADPVRCLHPEASAAMIAEVDAARSDGDTLGGVVEILAYGLPPGLGSHAQ